MGLIQKAPLTTLGPSLGPKPLRGPGPFRAEQTVHATDSTPGSSHDQSSPAAAPSAAKASGPLISRPAEALAQKALRGRAGRPSGLPINLSFRDPPYIGISVVSLGLLAYSPRAPCTALRFPITTLISLRRWFPIIIGFSPRSLDPAPGNPKRPSIGPGRGYQP